MNKLAGKVAVVTGGNSGMGLATAKEFAKQGAKVVITGRRQKDLDDAVKEIGANVEAVQGDIAKMEDLDRLAAHMKRVYGKVDIIFANAGLGNFTPLEAVTEEQFDLTFDVNVKGTFFTVQKLLSLVPDGGSIILNASIAANGGMASTSVYSASKAAIRSLARTWTSDLKSRKIRVNTLSPGPIETPIFGKSGLGDEQVAAFKTSLESQVPLGRMGHSDEIAKPALFLACDDSSYITGIELTVDGGMSQV
ncbi:MAG: SDR family oxidoreductase [Candidatus Obscuribacterales bacterium]|nr:SDR family oxidoreductase [Candidatus Obscuribacterales bacterium]